MLSLAGGQPPTNYFRHGPNRAASLAMVEWARARAGSHSGSYSCLDADCCAKVLELSARTDEARADLVEDVLIA